MIIALINFGMLLNSMACVCEKAISSLASFPNVEPLFQDAITLIEHTMKHLFSSFYLHYCRDVETVSILVSFPYLELSMKDVRALGEGER